MMQDIKMETFLAVCEYMNFTRAADALGLTQPAVSRQMKSLEEYYNVTLFHYEGKKCFSPLQGKPCTAMLPYPEVMRNISEKT